MVVPGCSLLLSILPTWVACIAGALSATGALCDHSVSKSFPLLLRLLACSSGFQAWLWKSACLKGARPSTGGLGPVPLHSSRFTVMSAKRKVEDLQAVPGPDESGSSNVTVIPLGAGQEVGRSCIIVKYLGKTVMLDCGVHPGYSGQPSLPYFDEVDLSTVDVMLVTHFHLDHCAAVPFVVGHTSFRGRIFMTHPTKAIVHTLLKDFVKVSGGRSGGGKLPGTGVLSPYELSIMGSGVRASEASLALGFSPGVALASTAS